MAPTDILSFVNLIGCIVAMCILWKACKPHHHFHRYLFQYINFMIFCLFAFGLYQIQAMVTPNFVTPWTMKLGVTLFWIKSIVFATRTLGILDRT